MDDKDRFKLFYTDTDVFNAEKYDNSINYKENETSYRLLKFTYVVSKKTVELYKKAIGIVDHEFLEEATHLELDKNAITGEDILSPQQEDDKHHYIINADYTCLNYQISEEIQETDLVFISEKCYKLFKRMFPYLKPIKKVLYENNGQIKVELRNPRIKALLIDNNDLILNKIKGSNIQDFVRHVYISRFLNGDDLKTILKEVANSFKMSSINQIKMFIPESNTFDVYNAKLLLKGELTVEEIVDENLDQFDIYQDRYIIFYYRGLGSTFKINFSKKDSSPMVLGHSYDRYMPRHTSGYRGYGSMEIEDESSGEENDGKVGLSNIGNTCFMNSALQCMFHTDILKDFMLKQDLKEEINENNPLGTKGELLESFAKLFKRYWHTNSRKLNPSDFKRTMSRHLPTFEGYSQHDSQEFLSQMLDTLHEDVNRIIDKPYTNTIEGKIGDSDEDIGRRSWVNFLKRNYSLFIENFYGQYKSTVTCNNCENTNITFDPYQIISLPIPVIIRENFSFYFLNADHTEKAIKFGFKAKSIKSFNDLPLSMIINEYAMKIKKNPERLRFAFLGFSKCGEILKVNETLSHFYQLNNLYVYRKPKIFLIELNDDDMLYKEKPDVLEIYLRTNYEFYDEERNTIERYTSEYYRKSREYSEDPIFTKFLYLTRNSTIRDLYIATLRKFYQKTSLYDEKKSNNTVLDTAFFSQLWKQLETKMKNRIFFYIDINKKKMSLDLLDTKLGDYLEESENKLEVNVYLYYPENTSTKIDISKYLSCSVDEEDDLDFISKNIQNHKDEYTIDDLLKTFSEPEILNNENMWYCSECKAHVIATKKLEIYKTPKYLIVHFKKLKCYSKKIPLITYPKTDLDMGPYVKNKQPTQSYKIKPNEFVNEEQIKYFQRNKKELLINCEGVSNKSTYDLFGVVNHYGSQNFGHYTSAVKVDGEWIEFNDSSVHKATETDVVGEGAYILFYKKNE